MTKRGTPERRVSGRKGCRWDVHIQVAGAGRAEARSRSRAEEPPIMTTRLELTKVAESLSMAAPNVHGGPMAMSVILAGIAVNLFGRKATASGWEGLASGAFGVTALGERVLGGEGVPACTEKCRAAQKSDARGVGARFGVTAGTPSPPKTTLTQPVTPKRPLCQALPPGRRCLPPRTVHAIRPNHAHAIGPLVNIGAASTRTPPPS